MRGGPGWEKDSGQIFRLQRFGSAFAICPLPLPLLRYSLVGRKKCDNRFNGRNSVIYVTLRSTLRGIYATPELARVSKLIVSA